MSIAADRLAVAYTPSKAVVPNRWVAEEFLWGREQQPL